MTASTQLDARELGAWGQAVALSFRFLWFCGVVISLGWLGSNIRQVPADSQAVVVRLGKVARVHGSGLVVALPRPIEEVELIPAAARQMQLGIARYVSGPQDPANSTMGFDLSNKVRLNAGFLLTGDLSVIHLEARLYYQISDPEAYLVSAAHVQVALQRLFMASAIQTMGQRDLDEILVARPEQAAGDKQRLDRERLAADLANSINRRLKVLVEGGGALGVMVSRVDLGPSIPRGAHTAFDSVLGVTQESEQTIAAARTNKELVLQKAESERDRITTDATAKAQEAVSRATVATASIAALGQGREDMSYGMQAARLYYDRVGSILKKAGKVVIVSSDGNSPTHAKGMP